MAPSPTTALGTARIFSLRARDLGRNLSDLVQRELLRLLEVGGWGLSEDECNHGKLRLWVWVRGCDFEVVHGQDLLRRRGTGLSITLWGLRSGVKGRGDAAGF